jgi:hypothetical protein
VKYFKQNLLFILLVFSFELVANSGITLPPINFDMTVVNGQEKLEELLLNPRRLLDRYEPAGAIITNKSVGNNQFQFNAEKTVLFYTANVFITSTFEISRGNKCISPEDKSYIVKMQFYGSDQLITDNIDKYEAHICAKIKSSNVLNIQVIATLTKGSSYSRIVGPIISDMISAQTNALVKAIKIELSQ